RVLFLLTETALGAISGFHFAFHMFVIAVFNLCMKSLMANKYHFLHRLALLAVPHWRYPMMAGSNLSLGLFSGTLYYHMERGDPVLNRAVPYGGSLLILGWITVVP
uniref:Uncharacterized protein n=1 Tax=Podarcis muralis TaxID=64176 RepID=A0A670IYG3_PODMU